MSSLLAHRKEAQLLGRTRVLPAAGCSAQAWREAAAILRSHVGGYRPALLGNTCPVTFGIFGGTMPEVDT